MINVPESPHTHHVIRWQQLFRFGMEDFSAQNHLLQYFVRRNNSSIQSLTIAEITRENVDLAQRFILQCLTFNRLSVCLTPVLLVEIESLATNFKECFAAIRHSHPVNDRMIWDRSRENLHILKLWRSSRRSQLRQPQVFHSVDAVTFGSMCDPGTNWTHEDYIDHVGSHFPNAKYIDCTNVPFAVLSCYRQVIDLEYSSNLVTLSVTIHDAYAAVKLAELFENMHHLKFLQTSFA